MYINATMWTSLAFLFLCAFFVTSFHSFSIVAVAFEINIAWAERSFVYASRFPEACVSERQTPESSKSYVTLDVPKFADQNNIRSSCPFLPKFTLESMSYSPDF